jgi:hypothetical protein
MSFLKNIPHIVKIGISYYDSRERKWRKFYPDFIIKCKDSYYIVETKGREEIQVVDKNISAKKWCQALTKATGKNWRYLYLKADDWIGKSFLGEII